VEKYLTYSTAWNLNLIR